MQQLLALVELGAHLSDRSGVVQEDHDVVAVPCHSPHLTHRCSNPLSVLEPEEPGEDDLRWKITIWSAPGDDPVSSVDLNPIGIIQVQELRDGFA